MSKKKTANTERESATKWIINILKQQRMDDDKSYYSHTRQLLSVLLWKYSEADGAKKGNRYWSLAAWTAYTNGEKSEFIHEHIVPRKMIVDLLLGLQDSEIETKVAQILKQFCHACVITKVENSIFKTQNLQQTMPSDWDENDIFARYRKVEFTSIGEVDWITGDNSFNEFSFLPKSRNESAYEQ